MAWTSTTTRATGYKVTAAVWNAEIVNNMTCLEEGRVRDNRRGRVRDRDL